MQWFTSMKGSFNSSTNSFPALKHGPSPGPAEYAIKSMSFSLSFVSSKASFNSSSRCSS